MWSFQHLAILSNEIHHYCANCIPEVTPKDQAEIDLGILHLKAINSQNPHLVV
jgi:hypothetical protein